MKKSQAIQELERLAFEDKHKRMPEIPVEWLAQPKFKDNSANSLTQATIAYIKLIGGQAERISTTGRAIDNSKTFVDVIGRTRQVGGVKWIPGTSTKGSADVSATIAGRSIKIEIKFGSDRQSEVQREYQKSIEFAGGVYLIARNFEQIKNEIDTLLELWNCKPT